MGTFREMNDAGTGGDIAGAERCEAEAGAAGVGDVQVSE